MRRGCLVKTGKLVALALVVAAVSHVAVIVVAPYVLMRGAMKRVSREGTSINRWNHGKRVSETSRRVVRPSPDLAYSACVYDLSDGPIRVTAAAWDDYMSVSAFAANSDNFFVINDRQAPNGVDFTLVREGEPKPADAAMVVESPSTRGIILQRRVAPTEERFAKADEIRQGDLCGPAPE
ncbi:MAG TPA: DUF1254 domain-containing protein [Nannocystaceae bacterium]|nr:DUF1254 domain-containing protein [Nannocystaceae bacterium]